MSQYTVLLVEEDRATREIYRLNLEYAGFRVVDVDGYARAIELLQHERVDIALLDLQFGGKSGLDILKYICKNYPLCPCITVSGHVDKKNAIEILREGAADYLEKPVDEHELIYVMQHWASYSSLEYENLRLKGIETMSLSLAESQKKYQRLVENCPNIIYSFSDKRGGLFYSHQVERILGYSPEYLYAHPLLWKESIHPEDRDRFAQHILDCKTSPGFAMEYRIKDVHGNWRWFNDQSIDTTEVDGEIIINGFAMDITERKKMEEDLRIAATVFETQDAVVITDANANIIRVNSAFTRITGFSAKEVVGKNPNIMRSDRHDGAFFTEMWQQLLSNGLWAGEIWDKRKNGQVYPKWMTITAVKNERQEVTQYVAIFSDITERKHLEQEIYHLAFYDALTKLPNRRLFMDRFSAALSASVRHNAYGATLFIDMDHFKALNDTLGHEYGDLLLKQVSGRIKSCVREIDTVARFGGDEFVVLIENISMERGDAISKVALVAEKIREALAQPYRLKRRKYHSSPSIGINLFKGNEEPVDALLECADIAMYQAKSSGRNAVRFFDSGMHQMEKQCELEDDLSQAITLNQLYLYYQIQVDKDDHPIGAEAFLRWMHPVYGMLEAGQFIKIAEKSSLIIDMGDWVLHTACQQLAIWHKHEKTRKLTLTVNISAKQFDQPDFVKKVAEIIRKYHVDPSHLKMDLSIRIEMSDIGSVLDKIHGLGKLGIGLSIDNFGGICATLPYLKQLSSGQIKIAHEFVQGISAKGADTPLVPSIINLAKLLDMNVNAEGVETEAQRTFLQDHDCKSYQGYLFGKPVAIEAFDASIS